MLGAVGLHRIIKVGVTGANMPPKRTRFGGGYPANQATLHSSLGPRFLQAQKIRPVNSFGIRRLGVRGPRTEDQASVATWPEWRRSPPSPRSIKTTTECSGLPLTGLETIVPMEPRHCVVVLSEYVLATDTDAKGQRRSWRKQALSTQKRIHIPNHKFRSRNFKNALHAQLI